MSSTHNNQGYPGNPVSYAHPYIPDPQHYMNCAFMPGDPTELEEIDLSRSQYPDLVDIKTAETQAPDKDPSKGSSKDETANSFTAPVAKMGTSPAPSRHKLIIQAKIISKHSPFEIKPAHDDYTERFALSPSERQPYPKDHYSDRFALSPIEREQETDEKTKKPMSPEVYHDGGEDYNDYLALSLVEEPVKPKKRGRKPKVNAKMQASEHQPLRRSRRSRQDVNYADE